MSPAKDEPHKMIVNGARPSPLKINRDSHLIHKTSSSTAFPHQRNQPVIIYTHSPKVIHTQARDFMALVQKLTGLSRSNTSDEIIAKAKQSPPQVLERQGNSNNNVKRKAVGGDEDNDSSSGLTEDNCRGGFSNPTMNSCSNPYFADIPLFTPTGADFFSSPRQVYRFPDSSSPGIGNLASPSLLEFLKGLPEY